MTKEEIKDFTLRVSSANSVDLVVILYDVILTDIKNAKISCEAGDFEAFRKDIHHATRFIHELTSCLDFNVELSLNLATLYSYCARLLSQAAAANRAELLDDVKAVIEPLRSSFSQISALDPSGPLMKNTQSVYAGLTYGKGYLNETFVDPRDYNRGFMA